MRNFKRILTLGLAAIMLFAVLSVSAFAAQSKFTDVNAKDETLTKAVSLLEGIGVTYGTSDTTFGTNEPVTRQQMAAFIYRLMKAGKTLEGGENTTPFVDLYDDTYYGMVSWANSLGIIKGVSDTEFNPDGSIILQDAYTMLVRALDYEKDGTLGYPFDFINIAEKSGVTLNKGLPSSVTYEKELTRGNVAVLLYNAFYAETGVPEIVEKERLIGQGNNKKYVLEKTEEYPKLCKKVYDVQEEEFLIRETTHYAFNDTKDSTAYKPTEDTAGENTVLLVATEDDQKIGSFYSNFEELGIDGSADDYIMSHVTVYYTYDEKDKKVEKVLFAQPLLQKASANTATYGSVSADRVKGDVEHFYAPSTAERPRMDGSMTVAGKTLYFYDAPFSFLKPSYNGCTTDDDKYAVRNEDDTLLIDLMCTDLDKGLYTYYIRDERFASKDGAVKDGDTWIAGSLNRKFADFFTQVRTNGIYAMDIYDPDGDGRYEYMWYKPASFGKIDMDDDYDFTDFDEYKSNGPVIEKVKNVVSGGLTEMPKIYANGATIDGAEGTTFRDGDFVGAYLNGDANYIYIFGSAQAKKGTISNYNSTTGTVTIGNQSFRTPYQYLYFNKYFQRASKNYDSGADLNIFKSVLLVPSALDTEVILYTYNHRENNVVYYEIISGKSTYSGEQILIPLEYETTATFDNKTKKTYQYLNVWVNGKEEYVKIDVDECYPELTKTIDGTYRLDVTVREEDGNTYEAYYGKMCSYSVDSNGMYTIRSILHAQDENGNADHVDLTFDAEDFFDAKKVNQAGTDLAVLGAKETARLKKITGKRYALVDAKDYSVLGTYGTNSATSHWFNDANITDSTTIIIREITVDDEGEEENEFHVYTGANFPGTMESMMENIQYIYENDEARVNRANLVLLYGEVNGTLEFEGTTSSKKSDWRIIKASTPAKISDKEFRYSYDVYNLSTGKVEEGVYGTNTKGSASSLASAEPLPVGALIKVTATGEINDKKDPVAVLNADTNKNLAFITDVDAAENVLELTPVNAEDEEYFTVDGEFFTVYELDEKVNVVVLKLSDKTDIGDAEISTISVEDLAAAKKDIKAYNSKVLDKNDKLTEKYAENVKAYVNYSKKSSADYPVIDTIIVVVNPDEPEDYLED